MLDFGWAELLLIVAVGIFVIGPKELPALMVGIGRIFRRVQYLRFALSNQMDEMMRDSGLKDIQDQVNFEAKNFDEAAADAEEHIDPADAHAQALKEREKDDE